MLRRRLNPKVAIYDPEMVREPGLPTLLKHAGIDLIHSHCNSFNAMVCGHALEFSRVPYLVSLHGQYDCEGASVTDAAMMRMLRCVSHWIYTATKNLQFLDGRPIDRSIISHIPNGMAFEPEPFPLTRGELGISEDDVVFALVSRPIPEKGWEEAIEAVISARRRVSRRLVLLLCGAGPFADNLKGTWSADRGIIFLGFQDRINGLYRLSDCALLPSRFAGKSFPLCLIQAMHSGAPAIATNVGSVSAMLQDGRRTAGIILEPQLDRKRFVTDLANAMVRMADDGFRAARAADASFIGRKFSIDRCAGHYHALYRQVMGLT